VINFDALQSKIGRVKWLGVGIIPLLLLVLSYGYVLAFDLPDSLTIDRAKAFQNLAETGDMLVVFQYNYDDTPYPTTPSDKTLIFRFYDEDGELISQDVPFDYWAFENNGYGIGVGGFYFDSSTAPEWGGAHVISIVGLPAYFDEPLEVSYILSDYSSAEGQYNSQYDLYSYVLTNLVDTLETEYGLVLKSGTSEISLTIYGATYFQNVISNLQTLCPKLFIYQMYVPSNMEITPDYDMSQGASYSERLQGTDLMRGAERLGDHIGNISGTFVWGIFSFFGCIGTCIFTQKKWGEVWPGMVICIGFVTLLALLIGNWAFNILMIGGLLAAMAIMWVLVLKRS
jgi:hypothetical protein